MSDIGVYCRFKGLENIAVASVPWYDDSFGDSFTAEELYTACFVDCVPQYTRGVLPTSTRGLMVSCGPSCGEELLAPMGLVVQALRRATLHGDLSITALDVCDGVGYDCFGYGGKVKISEKSMSGVTARELQGKSSLREIQELVESIQLRWDSICGGLLVDVRGAVSFQIVGVRFEKGAPIFQRIIGDDTAPTDTLVSLVSRAIRKGVVRVLHYAGADGQSSNPHDGLFAEVRLCRLKTGRCSPTLLAHTLFAHEVGTWRILRERFEREARVTRLVGEYESLVEELTTSAKRIKKARVALQEIRATMPALPPPSPLADSEEVVALDPRLDANHKVVADFWGLFQGITPLHSEVITCVRRTNALLGQRESGASQAPRDVITPTAMDLIDDIVCFICERAILMGEGVEDKNESYAWFDIKGSRDRLRGPDTWVQPLRLQIQNPYPRVKVEYPDETTFDSDTEVDVTNGKGGKGSATSTPVVQQQSAPEEASASASARQTGDPTLRKLNITKKHDTEEADKKYLMAVYDSLTLVQDVTKYLKAGTVMVKHGRIGSPHPRLFWVASVVSKMTLLWVDPEKRSSSAKTTIPLTDVCSVILGPFSKVFKRNSVNNEHKDFFLSFSITLRDESRTVDIVAPTLPDFEAWVLGICHMAHVDPFFGKKLALPNDEFTARLSEAERILCETWYIFPQAYIGVKDKIVGIREEVRQHLRLFGNNAEQAFVALGGIHLPQVNHKGAILMTKGELRHHCSSYNIDIFRVCEIWRVFSSQDLIYDLSYVPATNFGVTQRKVPFVGK